MSQPPFIPTSVIVGQRGPQGLPGPNAVPADEAVAAFITDEGSDTREALDALNLGAVQSVNGQVGDVAIPSVLGGSIGQVGGVTAKPGALSPTYGVELWTLTNFLAGYNTTELAPALTADGSNKTKRTLVALGNVVNQDLCFRVSLTVDSMPNDGGWGEVSALIVDSSGNVVNGTVQQTLANGGTLAGGGTGLGIPVEFDFKVGAWGVAGAYLEIRENIYNNASATGVAIKDVSVKQVAVAQRPLTFGIAGGENACVNVPLFDPVAGIWRMASSQFSGDGELANANTYIVGFNTDRPWQVNPPDPDFLGPHLGVNGTFAPNYLGAAGQARRSLRVNNDDQILHVKKTDGSYELRGNTHGGETLRSGAANNKFEYDAKGNGTWATWDGTVARLFPCRKFRFTYNTQIQRSDAGSPFANVDHRVTYFQDGMIRMDRTMTWLLDQRLGAHFDWMSSHDLNSPKVGRIGNGLIVLDEVDVFPKVATPAVPSNTPSTSGGLLAAGTRYYAVTALAEGGETTAGPTATAVNTGSTSSNALAWSAVSGATGYKVYRGASPTTLVHIATVAPIASPVYTDTGAAALGVAPPQVNKARKLDAATTAMDSASSDRASWAVWYDPIINMCFGNIYDRESIAARAEVASVKVRLEVGSGIMKNYLNTVMVPDGGNPDYNADLGIPTRLIPSGTVWTATHWAYTYVPADPVNYHLEIAARSVDLGELKTAYPNAF